MSKRIWLHQIKLSYSQLCHNIQEETQLVGREYKHNTCMLPKSLFTLMSGSASFQSNCSQLCHNDNITHHYHVQDNQHYHLEEKSYHMVNYKHLNQKS
jgi:hypothetical protein